MTSLDRRLPPGFLAESLREDARGGLTSVPKSLPPKWFYDAQGSALFEKITELPEYYPTRAEREILHATAGLVASQTGARTLVDPATLVAAYDDEAGVTAEFNKNVLAVLNAELGADFDRDEFEHVAVWDAEAEWIEMRLRSLSDQEVHLPGIGLTVRFAAGEEMRTEVSAKFRRQGVEAELAAAGFAMRTWWTDAAGQFGLSLSVPV
ncbi:MAG: L-histidine N(alpha)-methyltransferase [Streptosporangiaceae bacterium]